MMYPIVDRWIHMIKYAVIIAFTAGNTFDVNLWIAGRIVQKGRKVCKCELSTYTAVLYGYRSMLLLYMTS